MPELVPALDRLAGQLASPQARTLLTMAAVRPFFSGCTRTQTRLAAIQTAGIDAAAMLRPPLYQCAYDEWLGTVYTAQYRPTEGCVTYHWPGESWEHSFVGFSPGSRTVTLGLPDESDDR
ncbi:MULTISPECIES: hypothetical protein [Streptomyces]|uniref:Uncharacterized protein n=1 Tax=Streptomyces fimbriatus TaxID=68197 RepID=A0ABW0DB82_STRFI